MLRGIQSFSAVPLFCKGENPLQLDFDPYLADVSSTLFARKEMIVEQFCCPVEVPCLRQVKDQFKHQRIGGIGKLRIFLQSFHSLVSWVAKQAERLIQAEIDRNV